MGAREKPRLGWDQQSAHWWSGTLQRSQSRVWGPDCDADSWAADFAHFIRVEGSCSSAESEPAGWGE